MWWNVAAVGVGASAGALLRWGLGSLFAKTLPWLVVGTLAANWLGGLLIGIIAALTEWWPQISPQWRLLLVTGFLGGLTTFSGFSLEVAALIQQQRWLVALAVISLHVVGSVAMTLLGIALIQWLRSA
jgi:CrcB protein